MLPVRKPPLILQRRIAAILSAYDDLIEHLIFKNRSLRQTCDLILPKLISGELDVSHLNIDIK